MQDAHVLQGFQDVEEETLDPYYLDFRHFYKHLLSPSYSEPLSGLIPLIPL